MEYRCRLAAVPETTTVFVSPAWWLQQGVCAARYFGIYQRLRNWHKLKCHCFVENLLVGLAVSFTGGQLYPLLIGLSPSVLGGANVIFNTG
jgi:hypothetical protein